MAGPHVNLLVVCLLMFTGPLLTGAIPLAFSFANGWTTWMNLLGAGVLIGAAFAVVLPEGFRALYEAVPPCEAGDHAGDEDPEQEALLTSDGNHHQQSSSSNHWLPGAALLAGFLSMVLFEFAHNDAQPGQSKTGDCAKGIQCGPQSSTQSDSSSASHERSVLLALLMHAATDGLAVGVASMSTSTRLAVAIGMAMVLHKGPVAFGLSAYLISQHATTAKVCMALIVFALVAPAAALFSYGTLRMMNKSSSNTFVATCVLYSAGTFVYAACDHVLPDLSGESHSWSSVTVVFLGAVIPCSLNLLDLQPH